MVRRALDFTRLDDNAATDIVSPPAHRDNVVDLKSRPRRHETVFACVTGPHLYDHPNFGIARVVERSREQALQQLLEG
jgi:hypothetical protein